MQGLPCSYLNDLPVKNNHNKKKTKPKWLNFFLIFRFLLHTVITTSARSTA